MRMHSNTIFITGGSSGIGRYCRSLSQSWQPVILSGRSAESLQSICAENPGTRHCILDLTDPVAIRGVAARVPRFESMNQ
jgi:uncharacterized oxidoreductase